MSKKINATESLQYEGVEQLCQPKCLTGPKNYVSIIARAAQSMAYILAHLVQTYLEHLDTNCNGNHCMVLLITPKV